MQTFALLFPTVPQKYSGKVCSSLITLTHVHYETQHKRCGQVNVFVWYSPTAPFTLTASVLQSTQKKIYAWLSEAAQQQNRMSSDTSNNADKALELVKKLFSKETKIHLQTIVGKCEVTVLENKQWSPSLRSWWRVSPHIGKHKTTVWSCILTSYLHTLKVVMVK